MQNGNKNIVILGAAESGIGAAILAKQKGYGVFVSDFGEISEEYKSKLIHHNIDFEEGKHTTELILKADEVIKSPGIPDKVEIIQKLKQNNVKIISDIEFAYRFTNAKIIAVTGSNGKTTTASLIYHILKNNGKNVILAGNIGNSFCMEVANNQAEIYVLEISSFQLDYMFEFKANIAILTNITPDHLDRYNFDFNKYAESKMRILNNQDKADYFIYNSDDETINNIIEKKNIKSKLIPFSLKKEVAEGAYTKGNLLIINIKSDKFIMTLEELALQGRHNIYNSMAGGIASKLVEIRKEGIRNSLNNFQNIEHRLEYVTSIKQIEFINDSKATNVNSTWYALESMNKETVWIVGGVDKGNDYESLVPLVEEKVKSIVCLGIDNTNIKKAFAGAVDTIIETDNMNDAVTSAFYLSNRNGTVLLSPACASFDLFENYEQRGNAFKRAVQDL